MIVFPYTCSLCLHLYSSQYNYDSKQKSSQLQSVIIEIHFLLHSQSNWLSFHPTPPTATKEHKRTTRLNWIIEMSRLFVFAPPVTGVALYQAASNDVEVPEGSKPVDEWLF